MHTTFVKYKSDINHIKCSKWICKPITVIYIDCKNEWCQNPSSPKNWIQRLIKPVNLGTIWLSTVSWSISSEAKPSISWGNTSDLAAKQHSTVTRNIKQHTPLKCMCLWTIFHMHYPSHLINAQILTASEHSLRLSSPEMARQASNFDQLSPCNLLDSL